jgi:hypothetical protein
MKHFVHDFPLTVDFEQSEEVGKSVTGPVVELKPNGGDCTNDVDAVDACMEINRRPVFIVPGEELLNWAGK